MRNTQTPTLMKKIGSIWLLFIGAAFIASALQHLYCYGHYSGRHRTADTTPILENIGSVPDRLSGFLVGTGYGFAAASDYGMGWLSGNKEWDKFGDWRGSQAGIIYKYAIGRDIWDRPPSPPLGSSQQKLDGYKSQLEEYKQIFGENFAERIRQRYSVPILSIIFGIGIIWAGLRRTIYEKYSRSQVYKGNR